MSQRVGNEIPHSESSGMGLTIKEIENAKPKVSIAML